MTQNLPTPAGAVTVDPWMDGFDDGPVRTFTGSSWKVPLVDGEEWIVLAAATIVVLISGTQRANGTVHRWVQIDFAGTGANVDLYDLPTTTARMLGEALAAAVAEAERLNRADGGTMSSYPTFSAVDR